MAFEYTEVGVPLQGLDYSMMQPKQQQQPQQQGMSIDPNMIMDILNKFGVGGGNLASSAGSAGQGGASQLLGAGIGGGGSLASMAGPAGTGGASQLSGASLGGGVGGGGSGALAGLASNPWAWLAAVIVGNELYARPRGYRDEDTGDYIKDLFSGEVFHQDMEQRFLPKIGLEEGSKGNKWASALLNPFGGITADPGASWDRIKGLFD